MKASRLVRPVLGCLLLAAVASLASAQPAPFPGDADPWGGFNVGMASYTMRRFDLDETIRFTKELGLEGVSLKDFHLALDSTPEERQEAARKVREAGLIMAGCGVVTMRDEQQARQAFEYARDAGMPIITSVVPPELLPAVDRLVKEFDIKIAIHNHGPEDKLYPSPVDAYNAVLPYDERIGVCIDIGHTVRNGEDEVAVIHAVKDRLHDFHIKDESARAAEGKTVEMGRGVINIPAIMEALREIGYQGWINIEFEKDQNSPQPGVTEAAAYLRGVIAGLDAK